MVTPFAGVWIEINVSLPLTGYSSVTPFAGVWIEMYTQGMATSAVNVTPFAGVWIEIYTKVDKVKLQTCHSLCGSVE